MLCSNIMYSKLQYAEHPICFLQYTSPQRATDCSDKNTRLHRPFDPPFTTQRNGGFLCAAFQKYTLRRS